MSHSKIPHFRFYMTDFLDGTRFMTAAEVGDYVRLLCLIYEQDDGRLAFEPYRLRHPLNCARSTEVVSKVQRLIGQGKLNLSEDGYLTNGRATREIEKRQKWQQLSGAANPAANPAAKSAAKGAASGGKKVMKSAKAAPLARECLMSVKEKEKEKEKAPGNGSAVTHGSHGCEGRSPWSPSKEEEAMPEDKTPAKSHEERIRELQIKAKEPVEVTPALIKAMKAKKWIEDRQEDGK